MANTQTRDKERTAESMASSAQEFGTAAADKAKEFGSTAADKAKEFGSSVADKASDVASQAAQGARKFAENVGEKADSGVASVGSTMRGWGDSIRENAPSSGILGSASGQVADTLRNTGRYLEKQGLSGMGEDITTVIRRNPVPALLVAVGLGFLLARASRS